MDSVHDQTDLSQHPAYTVSDLGEIARDVRGATGPENVADTFLVDFKVDSLHVARGLGNIYLVVILRVGDNSKDFGRELE